MINFNLGCSVWAIAVLLFTNSAISSPFAKNRKATCLPASEQYTASITFSGCYTDASTRTLSGTQFSTVTGGNTPQNCANLCGAAGYVYAGVEDGR
jgi:beta-D-xylosidase 4